MWKRAIFLLSFCFAEKLSVFTSVTRRRAVYKVFFRRAGDETKSLIDHKKAYLQRKLINTERN